MNTITSWILAGVSVVAIGATMAAAVTTGRLADARAEVRSTRLELASAKAEIERQAADRFVAVRALEAERNRAVEAERHASSLREQIARDTDTVRDAPTAPVLRDTVRGLDRPINPVLRDTLRRLGSASP